MTSSIPPDFFRNFQDKFATSISEGKPTYGSLIYLLNFVEKNATYVKKFSLLKDLALGFYPNVKINREERFYNTCKRIELPTVPSILNNKHLEGEELNRYLQRKWTPKPGKANNTGNWGN